jgi:hypothetical protein
MKINNLNTEYRDVYSLVFHFYKDEEKTSLWMNTKNEHLDNMSPMDMINAGNSNQLILYINKNLI